MTFVAVTQAAAEELVADRRVQSSEFDVGFNLAEFLINLGRPPQLGSRLVVNEFKRGYYILSVAKSNNNLIVFDLAQAPVFGGRSHRDALLIFQKVLRFAVRYWNNQKLTPAERLISGSTKAVVFPFPVSQQTSFRVVIEREPDQKRAQNRPNYGNNLLVYKCSTEEGEGAQEVPHIANYRVAREGLQNAQSKTDLSGFDGSDQCNQITSLSVTKLDNNIENQRDANQGYDLWTSGFLTDRQAEFVRDALIEPHRIEGPAGTGKTLCLVLKAITTMRRAVSDGIECHALFVTHSEATRRSVQQLFDSNDSIGFSKRDRNMSAQSLSVTTLHELCGSLLGTGVSEAEFLDRDAFESKQAQLLYAEESLREAMEKDFSTHSHFLSESFSNYLRSADSWEVAILLQHEISVMIKGRAQGELENYKRLPPLKYGLPVCTDADKGFVFTIYDRYQKQLSVSGQFDTDDIVLSALGQLNTPIWRRRREREGFDAIFVDETHLFNINELSIFHYMTRSTTNFPIAYSVDRSQAVGDWGWTDELFEQVLGGGSETSDKTVMGSIFRCSPQIVNLACAVTSSGASLFTNFDDPLSMAASAFTEEEERKSSPPIYRLFANDLEMVKAAFASAESMVKAMEGSRADVAIVPFSEGLFHDLETSAKQLNKPVEILKARGDVDVVNRARRAGRFVLGASDYIGGLEFSGVVLVGVDKGRVPPTQTLGTVDSSHFLSYASHNRLYVAITRAKYRVEILASNERGLSSLFDRAVDSKLLGRGVES